MFALTFTLLAIVLLAVLILLALTLLAGLGFLGIGWVFSYLFPLGQYEATIVALGASIVLLFLAYIIVYAIREVEEDDDDEEEYELPIRQRLPRNLRHERRPKSTRR